MSLITFLSDFRQKDHYVSVVKASILSVNPALRILDIAHDIPNCNVAHASFVLSAAFREFPSGTIHLAAVGSDTSEEEGHLALQLEGHFFVGPNNGLFSLISEQKPSVVVYLDALSKREDTFVAKNKYAPAAAMLASGKSLYDLGHTHRSFNTLLQKRGTVQETQLQGHVIYVDATGNLITNLDKKTFIRSMEKSKKKHFEIVLGRERTQEIHTSYKDVEAGECFYLFNDRGLLEIGIRYGSAAQLLNASYDTPVCIQLS